LKLGQLGVSELARRLRGPGLSLDMAPFAVRVHSDAPTLAPQIAQMYAEFPALDEPGFHDFHVEVRRSTGWRRWVRPQAEFSFDGARSFVPLPLDQCFTMLEWGLNWCVAAHAHQYLLIHAAVLERNGVAALLPAPPGSGKSTLCAALALRGWRLITDELALVDMDTGLVTGMARPINLKNQSIDVMRRFEPSAVLTDPVPNTNKGTVALMRPPDAAVHRRLEPARPAWVVLPRYRAGAAPQLTEVERASTFMALAEQSFNYDIHGERGFAALGRLVSACRTFGFEYSALDDGIAVFDRLFKEGGA
jgi:hypothetical protein